MIRSFQAEMLKVDAYTLAEHITRSTGILRELVEEKEKGPEEVERLQNVEELLAGIQEFVKSSEEEELKTLPDFLLDVSLLTDADQEKTEDRNHVSLMTIHSSKGLEYPHVYIVGMEENLFPSQLSMSSKSDLEEERRLFYVALTRAMETCTLSYTGSRFVWNQSIRCEPSRFLDEIDASFVHHETPMRSQQGRSLMGGMDRSFTGGLNVSLKQPSLPRSLKSLSNLPNSPSQGSDFQDIKVGTNVEHSRFGRGKADAHDHVAELGKRRVGEDAFDVLLGQGGAGHQQQHSSDRHKNVVEAGEQTKVFFIRHWRTAHSRGVGTQGFGGFVADRPCADRALQIVFRIHRAFSPYGLAENARCVLLCQYSKAISPDRRSWPARP